MVIGETNTEAVVPPQPFGAHKATIDNIMSGIENTGAVKMNNHRKKLRQRFDIIKKLGQGTYGKVQLGINKETGQEVAIKTIKKSKIETDADLIRIRREVQIMSSVQHPNIIHIYEVFENREKMVLVMEFAAGGELYDYLSERKVLTEDEARRIFRQVSTAIYYCHKHKICHRDLKLENILLDENGNAKIADFGLSNVFDDQRLLATFCGSPLYASPEIVKGTPYQGPEVDCWSLGVLLYTLVYGAMPFDGANFKRLVKQISQGDYFEPKKPSRASQLIREMLTVCPEQRANIEQICNHWWVNEGYQECCLNLAENLANQTPVRLDVLLSLAPPAVTADQLLVGTPNEENKAKDRIQRSHSVGSVIDMADTEAERRILDMVAAGGEAALMPSPTRTITPTEMLQAQQQQQQQPKRKLETTVSTENATGAVKKKEKPTEKLKVDPSKHSIAENMEIDPGIVSSLTQTIVSENLKPSRTDISKDLQKIGNMCEELLNELPGDEPTAPVATAKSTNVIKTPEETVPKVVEKKDKTPVKKITAKNKTIDLSGAIDKTVTAVDEELVQAKAATAERKNSLPEETLVKPTERRRSRILDTAEKFQNMNNQNNEKYRKFTVPGVSVGNFKKEFERKASLTSPSAVMPIEKKMLERRRESLEQQKRSPSIETKSESAENLEKLSPATPVDNQPRELNKIPTRSDMNPIAESKSSFGSFSLEEARRSMENSIALLNKAKNESNKEVDQLCAKTENVAVSDEFDREKKLKAAREIIGNAIPFGRLSGVRKPPVPFGLNGRSVSGSVVPTPPSNLERKQLRPQSGSESSCDTLYPLNSQKKSPPLDDTTKTSRAEITLKSATLPRRKTTKAEIQLDIQPKVESSPIRFSTEVQHQLPDLRSAPIREHPITYTPGSVQQRANSLEPQQKEQFVPIQKPPTYQKPTGFRGSLSRQSTNESQDSDTATSFSQSQNPIEGGISTSSSATQPIKKSPREFIIPISVEGGGYITPRANSLEPSESSSTATTAATTASHTSAFGPRRISRPKRITSFLNERESEDESPFARLHRHTSIGRESDSEEPRFHTMHRLRSSRPSKRGTTQDQSNDSVSSGEDDDEDGFEILTAENLFSTLLSRVRALTNRINVNETPGFPSSRFMSNFRQPSSPFWNHEPFGSRLNGGTSSSWRHSMSRDLSSDIDSMFSRTGATLPRDRGTKFKTKTATNQPVDSTADLNINNNNIHNNNTKLDNSETLDLGDLDLSRLRLSKKDLETLSSLTPSLSKDVQEQLLAQLPPTQARKLSRTLSMQNGNATVAAATNAQHLREQKVYKRSLSNGNSSNSSNGSSRITFDDINRNKFDRDSLTPTNDYNENNIKCSNNNNYNYYRRSLSRGRYDLENNNTVVNSRSSSRCRDSVLAPIIDNTNRFSYGNHPALSQHNSTGDNKYKTYTPYSNYSNDNNIYDYERSKSLEYENNLNYEQHSNACLSPTRELYGRPPSGCISPPPMPGSSSSSYSSQQDPVIRRRSSQKRISRFLRPDFFDTPKEESIYDGKSEEDTQQLLREIREKSCDRSVQDQRNKSSDRLSYFIDKYSHNDATRLRSNKSPLENRYSCFEPSTTSTANASHTADFNSLVEQHEKLLSKSKDDMIDSNNFNGTEKINSFSDKILEELQNISITNSAIEQNNNKIDKKIKKLKAKSKTESETTSSSVTTTKKVIKKVATPKDKTLENTDGTNGIDKINNNDEKIDVSPENDVKLTPSATRESKLLRPKSYPVKEVDKLVIKKQNNSSDLILTATESRIGSAVSTAPNESIPVVNKITRPKSFPASKLTPPKEVKKINVNADVQNNNDSISGADKVVPVTPVADAKQISPPKDGTEVKKVKKIIKIVKKSSKTAEEKVVTTASSASSTPAAKKDKVNDKVEESAELTIVLPAPSPAPTASTTSEKSSSKKEKSPEKKPSKGFLYSLGQKIEKFRETTKSKEKKQKEEIINNNNNNENLEKVKKSQKEEAKEATPSPQPPPITPAPTTATAKSDRSSRIDSVIRNLRELSVPRGPSLTESGLIKRAVSVEEMPNTFNKCSVNKVLGLFKKIESTTSQIAPNNKSTKSTSYINTSVLNSATTASAKERPKSSGFVSKLKKQPPTLTVAPASMNNENNLIDSSDGRKSTGVNSKIPIKYNNCPNCNETDGDISDVLNSNIINNNNINSSNNINSNINNNNNNDINYVVTKRHSSNSNSLTADAGNKPPIMSVEEKERIKNNRKGLMLDFSKLNEANNNNVKGMAKERSNSYSFPPPLPNDILAGAATTPTTSSNSMYDNITNYSSGSRSPYDDCGVSTASTTFMSPTDEHELYFDDWSVCSDDNNSIIMGGGHSSSSNLSRLSRTSHLNNNFVGISNSNNSESVVDRIRRKSFYTRFNEKKPKRVSNIVGPAAKDYYRDTSSSASSTTPRLKSRPPSSTTNLSSSASSSTNDYYRLGGNVGKYDYSNKSNSNLNYLTTSGSARRLNYSNNNNINLINNNNNNNTLEHNPISSSFYGTSATTSSAYNPTKRRSSFTNGPISSSGVSSAGSSSITNPSSSTNNFIDSYATIGRKARAYDHRTVSLLDSSTVLRDPRSGFEHNGSVTRNFRIRNSSIPRTPTNI